MSRQSFRIVSEPGPRLLQTLVSRAPVTLRALVSEPAEEGLLSQFHSESLCPRTLASDFDARTLTLNTKSLIPKHALLTPNLPHLIHDQEM